MNTIDDDWVEAFAAVDEEDMVWDAEIPAAAIDAGAAAAAADHDDWGDDWEGEYEEDTFISPFFSLKLPRTNHRCKHCRKLFSRFLCAKCHTVCYCNKSCQMADSRSHERHCEAICHADYVYKQKRQELELHPNSFFTDSVWSTWFAGNNITWPYCDAADRLISSYRTCGSQEAIKQALELSLKLLFHKRDINFTLLENTPLFMLQLGMDQQAYDFISFYAALRPAEVRPYLSCWEGDRSVPLVFAKGVSLSFIVTDALVKYRLWKASLDKELLYLLLMAMRHATQGAQNAVLGNCDLTREIHSYLIGNKLTGLQNKRPQELRLALDEILTNGETVHSQTMWQLVVNSSSPLNNVQRSTKVKFTHIRSSLQSVVAAWEQTDGAMEFLRQRC